MGADDELREVARDRVNKRRDLATHAVVFVLVNTAFIAIWALTGGGYFWPAWILALWSVGLIMNVWDVYFRKPVTERDIQNEMRRLEG